MMDYRYCGTPVSQMSNEDLNICLAHGVKIVHNELSCENEESVMERLRIEKLIRALNLRSEA